MEIQNFRPVGKAVLNRLVGVRENYAISIPGACKECPIRRELQMYQLFPESAEYEEAIKKCRECENYPEYHCWNVKNSPVYKQYVNETNRYGDGKPLKLRAILLFLTYHMLCTDQNGLLEDVSLVELAEILQCSKKAVCYNNVLLQQNGYIYLSKGSRPGMVNVLLKEYTSYFKTASEGGRGFFTLSKKMYLSLINLRSTVQLRILLKTMLDVESKISFTEGIEESYRDMKRYLPRYCKRNVIQKVLSSLDETFCKVKLLKHNVLFWLNPEFDGKTVRQELRKDNLSFLKEKIDSVTLSIREAARLKSEPVFQVPAFRMQQQASAVSSRPFSVSDRQLEDLADISLDYSPGMVVDALAAVYYQMICNGQKVKNLGGLIRETIKSNLNISSVVVVA